MNKIRKKAEQSVSGVVTPIKWSDDGKVTLVEIRVDKQNAYLVEHNKIGERLLSLTHQKIEASGRIRNRLDGKILIYISDFVLIE